MIYHLCSRAQAEKAFAVGAYSPASIESEGFIHFSTAAQLLDVAGRFYRELDDPVLLAVDENAAENAALVRFEAVPDNAQPFPHYYAPLPVDRICAVIPFPRDCAGCYCLPPEVR